MLPHVIGGLATKLLIDLVKRNGGMPQSSYVSAIMKSLKEDDLDNAIRNYHLAIRWRKATEKTEIAKELVYGAICRREEKLRERLEEISLRLRPPFFSRQFFRNLMRIGPDLQELTQEEAECLEALRVLGRLKERVK